MVRLNLKLHQLFSLAFVVSFLLIGLFLFGSCDAKPKVLFIGDSLTYGTPFGTEYSWIATTGLEKNYEVVNMAIPGQSSSDILARFESDVINQKPQKVIIMCGTIDAFNSVHVSKYMSNINKMVSLTQKGNIKVVLVTPIPTNDPKINSMLQDYRSSLIDYARNNKINVIDFYPFMMDAQSKNLALLYDYDGIHPTKEGYSRMGQFAKKYLYKQNT